MIQRKIENTKNNRKISIYYKANLPVLIKSKSTLEF